MLRLLAAAAIVAVIVALPAYAQEELVTVSSNKQGYVQGEDIIVFGSVQRIDAKQISIQIWSSSDTLVDVGQPNVALDGSFIHTFRTGGKLWDAEGFYALKATYGGIVVEDTFRMSRSTGGAASDCTRLVDGGQLGNRNVRCTIAGGTLQSMQVDTGNLGLAINIEATSNGVLTLILDTDLIDAKGPAGANVAYVVRIDGVEVNHRETASSTVSRTIEVDFNQGESRIDVIGTMVVPEFGTVAMIVLALGVVAVLATRRTGLFALPR